MFQILAGTSGAQGCYLANKQANRPQDTVTERGSHFERGESFLSRAGGRQTPEGDEPQTKQHLDAAGGHLECVTVFRRLLEKSEVY